MDCLEIKQEPGPGGSLSNILEVKQETVVEIGLTDILEVKQESVVEIGLEDIIDDDNDSNYTNDPFDDSSDNSVGDYNSDSDPFKEENKYRAKNVEEPPQVNTSEVPRETLILNGEVVHDTSTGVSICDFTTTTNNEFSCKHCDFVGKRIRYVRKHIRKMHMDPVKLNQCPYCDFKTQNRLRNHIIVKHKEDYEIKWYRCNQCDYRAKTNDSFARHMRLHKPIEERLKYMTKCPHCHKMFRRLNKLRRHISSIHEKKPELICSLCQYEALDRKVLISHLERVHANDENLKMLSCERCNFQTKFNYVLKWHLNKGHRPKILCEKCPYQAKDPQAMKLHMINHKEVKNETDLKFCCDKCDYKTYRGYNLTVHKLNHLKPEDTQYFYCYHCEFKAKRKDNLKTHIHRTHFKKKTEFVCFVCDFKTNSKVSHIAHVNKHSKQQKEELELLEKSNHKVKKEKQKLQNSTKKKKIPQSKRIKVKENDDLEPKQPEINEFVPLKWNLRKREEKKPILIMMTDAT